MKLHKETRLTVADDAKRAKLRNDDRLKALQALSAIDLMPRQKLQDLMDRLDSMRVCSGLTESALQTGPVCPDCRYTPREEHSHSVAADAIRAIDAQIDETLESWTQNILNNLEDPVTKANLNLLHADEKAGVQKFIEKQEFEFPLDPTLIKALKQVLGGLQKISINARDLEAALQSGGPAKLDELQQRFTSYLEKVTSGKDPNKTRIVLE